jgi:hypothetical protein
MLQTSLWLDRLPLQALQRVRMPELLLLLLLQGLGCRCHPQAGWLHH